MGNRSQKVRIPTQDRSMETKKRIREAAEVLFSQKGYHHTNSKEIARSAGVATGSFYAYYKDKGELFCSIVERYYLQIFDEIKRIGTIAIQKKDSPVAVVKELLIALYEAHTIEPGLHREITILLLESKSPSSCKSPDAELYAKVSSYVQRLDREVLKWVEGLIAHAYPALDEKKKSLVAKLIFIVCEQLVHELRLSEKSQQESLVLLQELSQMVEAYLIQVGVED